MKTYCQGCGQETKKYKINCSNCGVRVSVPNIPTYITLSVISLFIFLPTGLVALLSSLQISSKITEGNFEDAVKYSKRARIWIVISLSLLMIYFAFTLFGYFNKSYLNSNLNNISTQVVQTKNISNDSGPAKIVVKEDNSSLQQYKEETIKGAILELAVAMEDWHKTTRKPFGSFNEEKINSNKLTGIIKRIRGEGKIELDFAIPATKVDFVVKMRAKGDGDFYCADHYSVTMKPDNGVSLVKLDGNNFNSQTNCIGKSLNVN
jgi:hypothetical protein